MGLAPPYILRYAALRMANWVMLKCLSIGLLVLVVLGSAGCGGGAEPRMRFGCYPSATVGTSFPDPRALGRHGYRSAGTEKNGIVYTCKAGQIDLAHLRIAADWTKYLAQLTYECLTRNDSQFSFRSKPAPSRYFVQIEYPKGWGDMPREERERIAGEVSLELGQYFAYTASTWHEIVTWFGYRFVGFLPEFASSFSWEDSFSNLVGTRIAVAALRDSEHVIDEAMTLAIDRELGELGVQSRRTAELASEKVRGEWFTGQVVYLVNMKKRNFDIGLDDGYVTPTLVPGLSDCWEAQAQRYPAPKLSAADKYGFKVKLEIEARIWEADKILSVVYPEGKAGRKRIEPAAHFAKIMDYIRQEAAVRYGLDAEMQP